MAGHRLVVAFTAIRHVGATLLVATGLAIALAVRGAVAQIVNATDVGVSYGAIAVFGTLTAAIPRSRRAAWIGWWLAVAFGSAALAAGISPRADATALVLGMLLGTRFGRPLNGPPDVTRC